MHLRVSRIAEATGANNWLQRSQSVLEEYFNIFKIKPGGIIAKPAL